MEQTVESDEDFKKGKEAMEKKEFSVAAEHFSNVLERFVELHGQLAPECGEVYYNYGLALFREVEHNEENADVFGPQVPQEVPTGRKEGTEEDKANSESENASSSKAEPGASTRKDDLATKQDNNANAEQENGVNEGSEDSDEDEDGPQEQEDEPAAGGESKDAKDSAPAEGDKQEVPDAAEDPLQLAWEVLDTARNIFEKDDTKELRLADTLLLLGDINLRNEMFELATKDYEQCLSIRQRLLKPDDRLIMEVHHQIAIARLYFKVPDRHAAVEALRRAVDVCELRVKNLRKALARAAAAAAAEDTAVAAAGVAAAVEEEMGVEGETSVKAEGKTRGELEEEISEFEEIKEELLARIESEEVPSGLPDQAPCSSADASSSTGTTTSGAAAVSNALGGAGLAALVAGAGIRSPQVGFGAAAAEAAVAATGSPVKVLGVFGKRKAAAAAPAPPAPAGAAAGKGEAEAEGGEGTGKRARLDVAAAAAAAVGEGKGSLKAEDISAAATPATQSPPKAAV